MSKHFPAFVAITGIAITATIFAFSQTAFAYPIGGTGTDATSSGFSSSSYDFSQSFGNLVSPFVDFFKNIQTNGQSFTFGAATGSGTGTGNGNGGTSGSSPITVTVNGGYYVNQFDTWFYQTTGVNIAGVTNAIVGFFSWFFHVIANAGEGLGHWLNNTFPTGPQ